MMNYLYWLKQHVWQVFSYYSSCLGDVLCERLWAVVELGRFAWLFSHFSAADDDDPESE